MATRSAIGFVEFDGSVTAIYCHWDGYPENNGRILEEHYTSIEKVEDLLELGNISVLGPNIGERVDFNSPAASNIQCIAYGRDRGELGRSIEAKQFSSILEYHTQFGGDCEYFYLFDGNEWIVADASGDFKPLGLVLSA